MGGNDDAIGERKAQHLDICADASRYDIEGGTTMLEQVRLLHRSLPEIDEQSVDTRTDFLDRTVSMPVFISSMTGGSTEGYRVNKTLARIAQEARIPVGMGSIRILFRKPEVIDHFMLKRIAPDVPVFANIGGVQLVEPDLDALIELVARLEVDAVAVHLNPGQELAQPEGDRRFRGVLDGIARLCDRSPVPVIVKETGFGIGAAEAHELVDRGVRYVDVAGSGGTNWVTVEGYRMKDADRAVAAEFADWGTPTAIALTTTRDLPGRILASGGVRTGMDVAKSLALGAQAAGLALPFVRAVVDGGYETGLAFAERLRSALRAAMTLTGSPDVASLRSAPVIETPAFIELTNRYRAAEEAARHRIPQPGSTVRGTR
ncbi:MAG: type 2 isopentenyl-diphosphate Delta-isomerase [Spirochaetota bacterium]